MKGGYDDAIFAMVVPCAQAGLAGEQARLLPPVAGLSGASLRACCSLAYSDHPGGAEMSRQKIRFLLIVLVLFLVAVGLYILIWRGI